MTRKEITEGLKLLEDNMVYFDELLNDKGKWIDVHELLFEAIKALSAEPCEDAVSRAEAIKALEYDLSIEADGGLDKYRTVIKDLLNAIYNTQKKAIEDLPSVKPVACIGKVEFDEEMLKDIVHETIEDYSRTKGDISVIEDIKAEIDSLQSELTTDMRRMIRKNRVMDILDKHIADMRGAE